MGLVQVGQGACTCVQVQKQTQNPTELGQRRLAVTVLSHFLLRWIRVFLNLVIGRKGHGKTTVGTVTHFQKGFLLKEQSKNKHRVPPSPLLISDWGF